MATVNAPTQEDPGVPARSPEVEAILQPVDIPCWAMESDPDSVMEPSMEVQEQGLEDPSLSPTPVEPPLGQGSSRQEFEQWSHQSETSDQKVQEYVLGLVRESMLCDRYQPERNSVWAEQKVFDKLIDLKLAPEQQSSVDSGIHIDQWALGKLQSQQPFNHL